MHLRFDSDAKMPKTFKRGDHVEWNSEAGRVRGTVMKKVVSDVEFKGYTHHATKEEPQYISSRAIRPTTSQFTKAQHFGFWNRRPQRTGLGHPENQGRNFEGVRLLMLHLLQERVARESARYVR